MKKLLYIPVLAVAMLTATASDESVVVVPVDYTEEETTEETEGEESSISPAAQACLQTAKLRMDELAEVLASVVDAASAAKQTPRIVAAYETLREIDFSALAAEDEEFVAAEVAEYMFTSLDAQLERLSAADFYGNEELMRHFGLNDAEHPAEAPAREQTAPEAEEEAPAPEADTESTLP